MVVIGIWSYVSTPIVTFPDVTNTKIEIVTQWPGKSAELVEKFVTIPLENQLNSVQKKISMRSISCFGLSDIVINFEDGIKDEDARLPVLSQISQADLPNGVQPQMQQPYGPTDEIYRYTLTSKTKSLTELTEIQDWYLYRQFMAISGIANIDVYGGKEKIYEVTVDPKLLAQHGLTTLDAYNAVANSNTTVGGDVVQMNGQAFAVQGLGLLHNVSDIEDIFVANNNGVPLYIKDIASVSQTYAPRLGRVMLDNSNDVVEVCLVQRKGLNPTDVLKEIHAKVDELNKELAKQDVKIVPYYDRTVLMDFATHTVLHNLLEGILFVVVIVFLFMAEWRTTLIVAFIIPLALLFAFTCLHWMGMKANLLSMGAVDFGIIIDGAVVMVEGLFVAMDHLAAEKGMDRFNKMAKLSVFRNVATEKAKAIFFSKIVILVCLVPIFSFQRVEGKLFGPLAYTLAFALLGALIYTLTFVPALASILLRKNVKEKHNPIISGLEKATDWAAAKTIKHKTPSQIFAYLAAIITFISAGWIGTEFLPKLNEGSLWITAKLPLSSSLDNAYTVSAKMMDIIKRNYPEAKHVLVQIGRPNDGTDPKTFNNVQFSVDLYPKEQWKKKRTLEELEDAMYKDLNVVPGMDLNFAQYISDNVAEAVVGIPAENALKIFGPDQGVLEKKSKEAQLLLRNVKGVADLGEFKEIGQPEINVYLDQKKMAMYGVNMQNANNVIATAIGGQAATELYEGDRHFDVRVRLPETDRSSIPAIAALKVPTADGSFVPLSNIATVKEETGAGFVYRDKNTRYIGVKFSVRDRDLGGTIKDAMATVNKNLKLPPGYTTAWNGEYENKIRAEHSLQISSPICLVAIFIILFIAFRNISDSILVLLDIPFALMGGILMLELRHMNFSVSAGIGFIALAGICIQDGVIILQKFRDNIAAGMPLLKAVHEGVVSRVRPVVMTAVMAAIGLAPAAFSTGIGSESQKPLATVVIGGLVLSTIRTLLLLPLNYMTAQYIINKVKNRKRKKKGLELPPIAE